ncbi:unnamed protein product [Rotaria sp. Silwood2]|nr:unnamed protein product [Rotaria sp. Silwood2]CAF4397412.1 unnamed protein product [Rotaria sp. Silwood2]
MIPDNWISLIQANYLDEIISRKPSNDTGSKATIAKHVLNEERMPKDNETIEKRAHMNDQEGTKLVDKVHEDSTMNLNRDLTVTSGTNVDMKKYELDVILNCKQLDLFKLEDLVQAGELQYINQTLKDISETLVDNFYCKHHTFPEFIQECVTPVMYLLKRLQNLDDFVNTLTFKYQRMQQKIDRKLTKTTNLSLRMLLHVLFMNSDIFLRRIIMSLVSKRNPVPIISPNIQNWNQNETYEFMPAIIHVWNHTRPTILSFGIGPCQGKSTLLNQLFQSTFEQSVESIYFQQTIDIDFGYCFNPERILNIADTHGTIDKKLLRKIERLFDGFLIQIDKQYFDQQLQVVIEYMEVLSKENFQMIIIRDSPNQNLVDHSLKIRNLAKQCELELSQKLHIYPLRNVSNTNDRNINFSIEDLREEILTKIQEEIKVTNDKDEVLANLQKLVKKDYFEYLKTMDKIIQPLKKRLLQKNEYQREQNFPLYLKFRELCKLRQQLKKIDFYGAECENMFEVNSQLFNLESDLDPNTNRSSPIQCGYVFDSFIEILKSKNMLMSLNLLASELKYELSSLGGDKLAGDLSIENAFLSLEVLWRNAIVCSNHTPIDTQNLIQKSYHDFVAAGFPFEIIDGDNFHFQHQFLTKFFIQFSSQRILVISIIGPQNSGKSTLLNYMFGTLFDVREGRCTRGIYGSFVKLDKSNQMIKNILKNSQQNENSDIDYIMLIDTEGLLSIEKGDKEYDRRLVLFSLAVSHLVIVNMMGDINETLKDMLTLCADSLKQIAIEKIIGDLKEKKLAEVIDISPKTFHTLPSAFKKERVSTDTKSPCFIRTEPDFIERTQQLCEKIIESAKSCYGRSGDMFSDPPRWLKTAVNIFDTLQKFPDLTYFKDINERQQDDQIRKAIGDLISKKLSTSYRERIIKDTCELTENEIRSNFHAEFDVQQNDFDNDLENLFKVTNASDRIRDRCRQFLKRQITEICNAWCTAAIQAHDKKQMESLVRDGSADLRNLIGDIIKSGKTMTKEKAKQVFESMWQRKVESIENNFKPEERLRQAIKFVYGNYNIFEKESLPSYEFVLSQLQFINDLSKEQNLNDVITGVQVYFVAQLSKLSASALELSRNKSDTNVVYTLATLHNFKHLRKDILNDLYTAGTTMEQEASRIQAMDLDEPEEQSHKKGTTKSSNTNIFKRAWKIGAAFLGFSQSSKTTNKSPTTNNAAPLRFDFIKAVHDAIMTEMTNNPNAKSNILNIPEFLQKIVKETITIVHGNDQDRRLIEIDLVQKIVGLINTHINESNLELVVFSLLLSKQAKSLIHIFILIILTIIYYDEQKTHFHHQLSILNEQQSSLLTYFIGMVVPDADCDIEGAKLFANKVLNTIQSSLMRDGQKIIARMIQAQGNLNRKHIQTICDGKLHAAASEGDESLAVASNKGDYLSTTSGKDSWLFRYIVAPTDIIVKEFRELWKAAEETINQQLAKEKNQWRNNLIEFFNRIEFMISLLEGEGSSVLFIEDVFEASGGIAADNLKNKGQCMALLLCAYLSGNQIQAGTSYIVFDKKYTLKDKGLRLFDRLPPPTQQLANLIKGMSDVVKSNDNPMVIASIKNLRTFLKSIMDVKSEVENSYDNTPATFATFDKDQTYNKLLDRARGCTSKCPCCQRPCDVDHSLIKSNPGIKIFINFLFFHLIEEN